MTSTGLAHGRDGDDNGDDDDGMHNVVCTGAAHWSESRNCQKSGRSALSSSSAGSLPRTRWVFQSSSWSSNRIQVVFTQASLRTQSLMMFGTWRTSPAKQRDQRPFTSALPIVRFRSFLREFLKRQMSLQRIKASLWDLMIRNNSRRPTSFRQAPQ